VRFQNCRLGSSVTLASTPANPANGRIYVSISDTGATGSRQEIYDYAGTLTTETTNVRAGGASDGTTAISWKVVTSANCSAFTPFELFEIVAWFETGLGSAHTATIAVMSGATLTQNQVWMDIEALETSSYPLSTRVTTRTDFLPSTSPASLPTDTGSSWTTSGVSGPVKQYIQASFTPQLASYVRAKVFVAKPSQTLWIDPDLQLV
jgi:hypothetical protein